MKKVKLCDLISLLNDWSSKRHDSGSESYTLMNKIMPHTCSEQCGKWAEALLESELVGAELFRLFQIDRLLASDSEQVRNLLMELPTYGDDEAMKLNLAYIFHPLKIAYMITAYGLSVDDSAEDGAVMFDALVHKQASAIL